MSDLASFRGLVQHYSACLPYILPVVSLLSSVISSEAEPDFDRPPPHRERGRCKILFGTFSKSSPSCRPLWPLIPSTLHAAFLAGETGSAHIAVITWDASQHGWGMVLRWWTNQEGKVIIGTLPDSDDMRHQVLRETFAGVLALELTS